VIQCPLCVSLVVDTLPDDATRGSRVKVTVDTELCAGHAQCAALAPEVYELDDLGYSLPLDVEITDVTLAEQARKGAQACPEGAIRIVE
jgi:ferredoxin